MKQNVSHTAPLAFSIEQTARLFGKQSRNFVYRNTGPDGFEIVKIGLRSSAVTRASIERFAAKRGIPAAF